MHHHAGISQTMSNAYLCCTIDKSQESDDANGHFHVIFCLRKLLAKKKHINQHGWHYSSTYSTSDTSSASCIQRTPGCRGRLSYPWTGLNLASRATLITNSHLMAILSYSWWIKIESNSDKPLGMAKTAHVNYRESLDVYHINWFRILSHFIHQEYHWTITDITTLEFNCEGQAICSENFTVSEGFLFQTVPIHLVYKIAYIVYIYN